jgi:hypothetical protein
MEVSLAAEISSSKVTAASTGGAPGEWPSSAEDLPLLIREEQFAHLRGVTVRTLQRERQRNASIPYVKDGRRVWYARSHVLERFGLSAR